MPVLLGGQPIKAVKMGTGTGVVDAKRIMLGIGGSAVEVWSAIPPFADSGMQKVGNQTAPSGVWTDVVDWAGRDGFEGTVIESNGVRIPVGVSVTWKHSVFIQAAPLDSRETVRLMNGGTVVPGSLVGNSAYNHPPETSGTFVGTGDIVRLQVNLSSSSGRRTVTPSTFLEIRRTPS